MSLNPQLTDWTGRTAWLVGASTGIGRATASLLHARGARVVVSARNARALDEFVAAHPGSLGLPLDVTDRAAVAAAATQVVAERGAIDLVLYCAGHYRAMRATDFDLDEALRHVQVNQVGALHVIAAVLPVLLEQRTRPPEPRLERRRLPRPAELDRLRADQGGADQPGRDAVPRPVAAGHRRLGDQPRLRRDAADGAECVHHARADHARPGRARDRPGLGGGALRDPLPEALHALAEGAAAASRRLYFRAIRRVTGL